MGRSYTNITLKGPERDAIEVALVNMKRQAVVTPTCDSLTVVFDAASEDQDGYVYDLASNLSRDLSCIALAVTNHDDSVLYFKVYDRGELIDTYNSCPSYFEDVEPLPPSGGNAELLCSLFARPGNATNVEEILCFDALADDADDRYVFESERHIDLIDALGLSRHAAGLGFEAVMAGELPEGLNLSDFRILTT